MKLEEAMKNLEVICAAFQGNLDQHKALQQSLQIVKEALGEKNGLQRDSGAVHKDKREGISKSH